MTQSKRDTGSGAGRGVVGMLALLAAGAGCAGSRYLSNPQNPFPDVRTVAVLPVMNQSSLALRAEAIEELSEVFASELVSFPGFTVIRPQRLAARAREKGVPALGCMQDAIDLAREAGADAVLCVAITDWKGYPPPRLGLAVELFRTRASQMSGVDIDRWTQTGKPFAVERGKEGHVLAALERVIDSHHGAWRAEIESFGAAHSDKDYAFKGGAQYLLVDRLFFQFASNWMLREIVAMHAAPLPSAGAAAGR